MEKPAKPHQRVYAAALARFIADGYNEHALLLLFTAHSNAHQTTSSGAVWGAQKSALNEKTSKRRCANARGVNSTAKASASPGCR
eukprot:2384704-Amphidinium_carterae.3